MKLVIFMAIAAISISGCGKKKTTKSAAVSAKVRSTGLSTLKLAGTDLDLTTTTTLGSGMLANVVTLEYYKVPIRRINLIGGGNHGAAGYTTASENFYTCDAAKTDAECSIDLSQGITVDNLLAGAGASALTVEGDVTYDGAAVEFCPDGTGTTGRTYKVKIKGSVLMGSTTYYTSATSGLSSSLTAAEEAEITVPCSGASTYFADTVTLGPDKPVSMVIYADPNGNVFGTTYKTLANSNCLGEETLALCAGVPSIFLTVDSATPTVERYKLTVTTKTSSSAAYRNLMLKMLFNTSDVAIGGTIQEYYLNDTADKSLHSAFFNLGTATKNADSTFTFSFSGNSIIEKFKRGTDTGNKVLSTVTEVLTFDQAKLQ